MTESPVTAKPRTRPPYPTPGPYAIVEIDLDGAVTSPKIDERYKGAMMIARRGGVPVASATVDFVGDDRPFRDLVADFAASVSMATTTSAPAVLDADLPSISVVVPTIVERTEDVRILFDSLAKVDYPNLEIVFADNRRVVPASDDLAALVARLPRSRTVRAPQPGISAARNAGMKAAENDIIVFTDDDVRVDPHWLRAIGSRFAQEPELDIVTGLILPAELETSAQIWFERYYGGFAGERLFAPLTIVPRADLSRPLRFSRARVTNAEGVVIREFPIYGIGSYGAGANMAIRKSALERIAGYNLALGAGSKARGGEDLEVFTRLLWTGSRMGYEPSAVVSHTHRREYEELLSQLDGYGVGFTAILTALMTSDARHVLGIGYQVPLAMATVVRQSLNRISRSRKSTPVAQSDAASAGADASYPRALLGKELGGMPRGPFAYARSVGATRRWARANPTV